MSNNYVYPVNPSDRSRFMATSGPRRRLGWSGYAAQSGRTLSDDEIRDVAPSVFAAEAHESRSERYGYIPTATVVSGLRDAGFAPTMATQQRVRDASRVEYCKHMLRFKPVSGSALDRAKDAAGMASGEYPELVLVNSHDGSSAYKLMAGWFRMVCSNGMVVCSSLMDEIKCRHTAGVVGDVIEGSYRVIGESTAIAQSRNAMAAITLSDREREIMADAALVAKYGTTDAGTSAAPITAGKVLMPQRYEDRKPDLWTAVNVVQENLIRGGQRGRSANGRRTTTREVKGIDGNVNLNRAIWQLGEQMRALKVQQAA